MGRSVEQQDVINKYGKIGEQLIERYTAHSAHKAMRYDRFKGIYKSRAAFMRVLNKHIRETYAFIEVGDKVYVIDEVGLVRNRKQAKSV